VSVTFLIPLFAILWGAVFLGEAITAQMVAGGGIVLVGIALALGLVGPKPR
jgi:drug/metabolite transporter (DMT)-like permease